MARMQRRRDEETKRGRDPELKDGSMWRFRDGEMQGCRDAGMQLDSALSKTCTAGIPSGILFSFEAAASTVC